MATDRTKRAAEHERTVRQNRKNTARFSAGPGMGGKLLLTLAIAAAVVFGAAIFFKVRIVEVQGNAIYSAQTVAEASGICVGDNLLSVNKAAAAGRIRVQLPYVEQVRVARILPDTVVLEVTESEAVFCVRAENGEAWLISFSGKVIEQSAAAAEPTVKGLILRDPVPGLPAESKNTEALDAAVSLLGFLRGTGLTDCIRSVDVSKPYDLIMEVDGRFTVKLGGTDQMEYKMQFLGEVLGRLDSYQSGTIDLTFDGEKVARFIPA